METGRGKAPAIHGPNNGTGPMTPLSALFGMFATIGLLLAVLGHAAKAGSPAPSMVRNDLSPIGYGIFIVCGLIALAALGSR